ncbi:MAG: SDR family oxidoreductase [Desulfatiglans sp.]|jgi:gluconate 5-dehydrogenase|nr:SDR family oxidoreductase [Desulfatiglans sp.]
MSDQFRLDGRVALINGGAGGIGGGLCLGLSKAGAKIVIADMLDEKILQEKAAELKAETGNDAIGHYVNVTDEESVAKMINAVVEKFGTIDICVNSMGINLKRPALEFPMEDWDKMFNVNVKGTMICCKHVGSLMKENKKGSIINLSSVRGIRGYTGGNSAYCGTKGAVELITKTLAIELAPFNVRVNAIGPSLVITPGTIHIQKDPELAEKYKALIPLGRLAQVEDMVGPVVFLASDAAGFVTGQTIFIDGGATAS